MALAARIRGDALSPVEASLSLAGVMNSNNTFFEEAMLQAYETALNLSIIY